ncbi:MAG TPA: TlpA disulfide reductase family protein [Solirubrobacteraceae bacterium]|jgi:thiol-disulfide isomerase/thioredoxin
MRRALPIAALIALVAAVVVGLAQAGGGDGGGTADKTAFDLDASLAQLRGAPAPLAALHRDAAALLPGGRRAFAARVRRLRGHPVVINKWASWCGPCQLEFPYFQRQGTTQGKRVAFLGIDAKDSEGTASTFLRDHPIPFPSYSDPDGEIAARYARTAAFPTTVFLDAEGRTAYVHQGQYRRERDLAADIERYLLR